uniref:Uncharacterized protein n=1 Tax=Oryza nivara TaxID=4536 RepID=A0A0E0GMN6_ORYNI
MHVKDCSREEDTFTVFMALRKVKELQGSQEPRIPSLFLLLNHASKGIPTHSICKGNTDSYNCCIHIL